MTRLCEAEGEEEKDEGTHGAREGGWMDGWRVSRQDDVEIVDTRSNGALYVSIPAVLLAA